MEINRTSFYYLFQAIKQGIISKDDLTKELKNLKEYELSEQDDRIVEFYHMWRYVLTLEQRKIILDYIFSCSHLCKVYMIHSSNMSEDELQKVLKGMETGPIYYYFVLRDKSRKYSKREKDLLFECLLKHFEKAILEDPDMYTSIELDYTIFSWKQLNRIIDRIFELKMFEVIPHIKKSYRNWTLPPEISDKLDSLLVANKLIQP